MSCDPSSRGGGESRPARQAGTSGPVQASVLVSREVGGARIATRVGIKPNPRELIAQAIAAGLGDDWMIERIYADCRKLEMQT